MEKGYVFVTGYGLCKFKGIESVTLLGSFNRQTKGDIKLPKGVKTTEGKKWMALDYWFFDHQVFSTKKEALCSHKFNHFNK